MIPEEFEPSYLGSYLNHYTRNLISCHQIYGHLHRWSGTSGILFFIGFMDSRFIIMLALTELLLYLNGFVLIKFDLMYCKPFQER